MSLFLIVAIRRKLCKKTIAEYNSKSSKAGPMRGSLSQSGQTEERQRVQASNPYTDAVMLVRLQ